MATTHTSEKDKNKRADAPQVDENQTTAPDSPQVQPEYKPDANVETDNRRSDYDQPNLNNPDSQAIHRDVFEDGGEGDKAENHKGDKAWDINVKENDEQNRKDAQKDADK